MKRIAALAALLALGSGTALPAADGRTDVPVGAFDAIDLRGGGRVTVRHGREHRVTLVRGTLAMSRVAVERRAGNEGRTLVIQACRSACRNYDLRVEIETPDLDAAAVTGGGTIRFERLPAQANVALAVTGGGEIDARAFPAANVAASIRGGGTIDTRAEATLAAAVQGGGTVRYSGPVQPVTAIRGGGEVVRAR